MIGTNELCWAYWEQMSANALARQTEQISETDIAGELQSAKAQIRRLTKSQTEAEERVRYLARFGLRCLLSSDRASVWLVGN